MKKLLTLILTALMTLTAVFGLTACSKGNTTVNPRNKYIVVGYTDYAPMNYNDNGVFKGFDTELAIMTFEALGYNVKFQVINWQNKYVELTNNVDCIWNGFTSNGKDENESGQVVERAQLVDFTYNYMENAQCIIRMSGTPAITSPTDFAGKSLTFENGSSGASLASSYKTGDAEDPSDDVNVMLEGSKTQMEAVQKVFSGSCPYAIVDLRLAQTAINGGGYSGLTINEGLDIGIEYYAVAFAKGSELVEKVNTMFEAFAKTGYLLELATKYKLDNAVILDFANQK